MERLLLKGVTASAVFGNEHRRFRPLCCRAWNRRQ
jgi:hypothetical protein